MGRLLLPHHLYSIQRYNVILVILSLAVTGASAFCPTVQPRARSLSLTRRYVSNSNHNSSNNNKWQIPFLAEQQGEDTASSSSNSKTFQANDFEVPRPVTNNHFLSSFFPQDTAESSKKSMGNLVENLDDKEDNGMVGAVSDNLAPLLGVVAVATLAAAASMSGVDVGVLSSQVSDAVGQFFQDPTAALEQVTELVANMGPLGPLYFGLMYITAEVLAIPAVPLTASAGYLFGVSTGTLVVLVSASIASSISFVIGRTLLRTTVEQMMKDTPQFAKMDKAIGKEGFKLILLLRLSPLFPFALSNYLYGATSIDFASFFWGTLLGFAPGTLAYVYTGVVGKALTLGGADAQPWYVYAGGAVVLGGLIKLLVDVASNIVAEIEEEADMES